MTLLLVSDYLTDMYSRMSDTMEESNSHIFLTHEIAGLLRRPCAVTTAKADNKLIMTALYPA